MTNPDHIAAHLAARRADARRAGADAYGEVVLAIGYATGIGSIVKLKPQRVPVGGHAAEGLVDQGSVGASMRPIYLHALGHGDAASVAVVRGLVIHSVGAQGEAQGTTEAEGQAVAPSACGAGAVVHQLAPAIEATAPLSAVCAALATEADAVTVGIGSVSLRAAHSCGVVVAGYTAAAAGTLDAPGAAGAAMSPAQAVGTAQVGLLLADGSVAAVAAATGRVHAFPQRAAGEAASVPVSTGHAQASSPSAKATGVHDPDESFAITFALAAAA